MRNPAVSGRFFSVSSSIFDASCARRLDRQLALAVGRRRKPQEVDVVRVVGHRIEPLRAALGDVVLVGGNRQLVALDRVRIAADALIDVRRHVHHVPRRRHERQQRVGRLLGFLRRRRALHQMDVHVHARPDASGCAPSPAR